MFLDLPENPPKEIQLTKAGDFQNYAHGIKGEVFVKDEQTLVIKGFEWYKQSYLLIFYGCFPLGYQDQWNSKN